MVRRLLVVTVVAALLGLAGPAVSARAGEPRGYPPGPSYRSDVVLPTPDVDWDYQIGGAFAPAPGVGIVSRDRNDTPLAGAYNVCYVNAFQTQGSEKSFWRDHPARWALVLKGGDGQPVVDANWGEFLLDTRTPARRRHLARIVGRWIDGCAADGYDAVELDNLDSWDRAGGLIAQRDNRAFARLLTRRGHRAGLAVAQKNWAELSPRGPRIGFDFAVAEECGRYDECGSYAAAYAHRVLVVEYRDQDFDKTCQQWGDRLSVVRRDVPVSPDGVNRRC